MPASATMVQGNSLQNQLDNRTFGNSSGTVDADFYDVEADQISNDAIWNITAPGASTATLLFELAGFRNANTFGIYDIFDPSNTLQIFSGSDSAGAFEVTTTGPGNSFQTVIPGGGVDSATFATSNFGFYLSGPGGMFYSQSSLNAGNADQMIAFQGQGDIYVDATGFSPGLFTAGQFILAWEDLPFGNTDSDYNDFVVLVSNVTPVPAPAALGLLGLALFGLGIGRRRRY
ncbi:MAG: DUF4114 domain-containing protein [Pseudomonadota bacterium]